MNDVTRITEMIKAKIESQYKDDIALFVYYGSQAMGMADTYSDLDFFFIPRTEKGKELMIQFVIDGIGYDLFPITWERIGKIAALEQPLAAVITESKVVYAGSDEELERYEKLRALIQLQYDGSHGEQLLNKSKEYFNDAYAHFFNMENGQRSFAGCHVEASKLVGKVVLTVAMLNGQWFKRGMGKELNSVYQYEKLPTGFENLVESILHEEDLDVLIENCRTLLLDVKELMNGEDKVYSVKEPYSTLFEGYYEELKSTLNKVVRACDEKDAHTVYFRALSIQEETSLFMAKAEQGLWHDGTDHYQRYREGYDRLIAIDLISPAIAKDYELMKKRIHDFDLAFKSFLESKDVDLIIYESLEAFEAYYRDRA